MPKRSNKFEACWSQKRQSWHRKW